jgi:hypothetical protein
LDARLTTLLYKKDIVAKSKEVKHGCNWAESSKEGYGSNRAVFANDDFFWNPVQFRPSYWT